MRGCMQGGGVGGVGGGGGGGGGWGNKQGIFRTNRLALLIAGGRREPGRAGRGAGGRLQRLSKQGL